MTAAPSQDDGWYSIITAEKVVGGRFSDLIPKRDGPLGNFSLTFSALDSVTNERVFIKFLHPGHSRGYRAACFRREVEVAKTLIGCEHIVQLVGEPSDLIVTITANGILAPLPLPYYVLEHASGTFSTYLFQRTPPGLRRRVEIVRDIVKGVGRLHRHGYCHRDLKPDNVLLFSGGVAKIADFGTARTLADGEPPLVGEYNGPQGTLLYAAPELLMGAWNRRHLFAGADWFAVGSILFEALTNLPLYVHIGLRNDMRDWIGEFGAMPDPRRVEVFEKHVEAIAGRYPIPSLADFRLGNDHLAMASPGSLEAADRLVKGLCHFSFRKRLTDFDAIMRGIDIALGHIRLDEARRSRRALRGGDVAKPAPLAVQSVTGRDI